MSGLGQKLIAPGLSSLTGLAATAFGFPEVGIPLVAGGAGSGAGTLLGQAAGGPRGANMGSALGALAGGTGGLAYNNWDTLSAIPGQLSNWWTNLRNTTSIPGISGVPGQGPLRETNLPTDPNVVGGPLGPVQQAQAAARPNAAASAPGGGSGWSMAAALAPMALSSMFSPQPRPLMQPQLQQAPRPAPAPPPGSLVAYQQFLQLAAARSMKPRPCNAACAMLARPRNMPLFTSVTTYVLASCCFKVATLGNHRLGRETRHH